MESLQPQKPISKSFILGGGKILRPESRAQLPPALRSRGVNTKPDPRWLCALGLLLVTVVVLTWLGGETMNYVAGVAGLFGSVILLGFARSKETKLRASGRFSEWRIRSTTITMGLFLSAWTVGIANVFFVAKEWTRS